MPEAAELRLLMEIKGDVGETRGLVAAVREDLAAHRVEDREALGEVKERVARIETQQAEAIGAARHREHGEVRQAGIVAALIAGLISFLGAIWPHWGGR
jgi:hypothetical protein